jgi:hypothetical protein
LFCLFFNHLYPPTISANAISTPNIPPTIAPALLFFPPVAYKLTKHLSFHQNIIQIGAKF